MNYLSDLNPAQKQASTQIEGPMMVIAGAGSGKTKVLTYRISYLIDNNIKEKGEFQLTNALENMKQKGKIFSIGTVDEWLDCGNKDATVYTSQRVLEHNKNTSMVL